MSFMEYLTKTLLIDNYIDLSDCSSFSVSTFRSFFFLGNAIFSLSWFNRPFDGWNVIYTSRSVNKIISNIMIFVFNRRFLCFYSIFHHFLTFFFSHMTHWNWNFECFPRLLRFLSDWRHGISFFDVFCCFGSVSARVAFKLLLQLSLVLPYSSLFLHL